MRKPKPNYNANITEEQLAERVRKFDEYGIAYCPECKSPSLSPCITESGAFDMVFCLKCGHRYFPGR